MGGESWYTTKIFKPHSQISRQGMQTIWLFHFYSYFETIFPWDHFNHLNFNFNLKCLNMKILTQEDFYSQKEDFLIQGSRFLLHHHFNSSLFF